ncbi:UV-damaged DNA-binding protein rad7 [Marasmius crinis-equi]|uniref:UV-damaged DNA-binding protein rad7 n=1 Tax=Marasmius crinis-equi TaxID=585013 RepID=A0ABR3FH30_9AGAR
MSRNNVRGPTSALTEFLRSSGITPSTVARRAATQNEVVAGPSNSVEEPSNAEESTSTTRTRSSRRTRAQMNGYASDELDEPESPPKKAKVAESTKGDAKGKNAKGKKKGAKKGDDEEYQDEDEDAYTALSKSIWSNPGPSAKPPVGSFENCAKCEKQFTVTKYTLAANDGTGFLCHACAKSSGMDPFKKPSPRKRKQPADKRKVVYFEEKRFPTLVSVCIDIISDYIDDIEAFGDIGAMNMQAISKAIAKNRRLTPENAPLFYGAENTSLTFYDATKLTPPAMVTLSQLNPNLTSLRLDFCGQMSNDVIESWKTTLPNLTSLELLGPFLVRAPAWVSFFESHQPLQNFLITQSPRFNLDCMKALVSTSASSLQRLRLREIGQMSDDFLEYIGECGNLTYLDISEPSNSCSDDAVSQLLAKVGPTLIHLNLSNHILLTDAVLEGLGKDVTRLSELVLSSLPCLTDEGVSNFFADWENPQLSYIDISRNPELLSNAVRSIMNHSGSRLQSLNINGLKDVDGDALGEIAKRAQDLKSVDLGWCREVDDFIMKSMFEACTALKEVKLWGCNKVEGKWVSSGTHTSARIFGIESQTVI